MKAAKIMVDFGVELKELGDRRMVWESSDSAMANKKMLESIVRFSPSRKERKAARSLLAEVRVWE